MMTVRGRWAAMMSIGVGFGAIPSAQAQLVPWVVFEDDFSASVCDVVNAFNAELVVLADTGELVIVTGPDVILARTLVDVSRFVFFDGALVGLIDFAEDGDGFRTLWWLSLTGRVIEVDPFTGEPSETSRFPDDFVNVPCDACEFWDNPFDCSFLDTDSDLDGVPDLLDDCPFTPLDEIADPGGCSCSQLDGDLDGVNDCFDLCLATPLGQPIDIHGCACVDLDGDGDGVGDCADGCPGTFPGDIVDFDGCACGQLDDDRDGVDNCNDFCPGTPLDVPVDPSGCAIGDDDGGTVIVCGSGVMPALTLSLLGLIGFGSRPRHRARGRMLLH